MFGHPAYFDLLRKYVVVFGTLFDDISISRTDASNNVVQVLSVPLTYSAKDKMLERVKQNPDLSKPAAIVLPRMSFEHGQMYYDGQRKLNTIQRVVRHNPSDPNTFLTQYNPVPFNIDFSLFVYVRNAEDGTKIVEQILPYFTPEFTVRLETISDLDIFLDVPIVFKTCNMTDNYTGDFTTLRTIVWELDFTMKAALYGPIKKNPIIKFSKERFFVGGLIGDYSNSVVDQIQVTPGLDANGQPTTDANVSINPLLIDLEQNWDYVVQKSGIMIEFE